MSQFCLILSSSTPRRSAGSFKALDPFEFQHDFLDEGFDRLYKSDTKFRTIFALFAGSSVFIACLGMFGLAVLKTEQKAREISIRKVLGTSAASIAALLSRHFLRRVVLADLFVLARAAAAALALAAISVQTAKASRIPAKPTCFS